MALYW